MAGNSMNNNFLPFWRELIDLRTGVDKIGTIAEIKEKKTMNGANAWMLMCSIVIASIGLNLNSPAIIIGAMLISPLMSPILGIGLAVGINDKTLLLDSLYHFGAAILIAVLTSSIYFYFSPFQELTNEISSRTSPTFLDVLIAFFGGVAGIVSITRKDLSTTLPGVAIATALMPPLCVTGFGIANGQWDIALNAFYLFFLNTLFVSIATYIIIRYMNFPYKKFVNPKEKTRNMVYVVSITIIAIIPSIFIFNRVYKELNTKIKLKSFIENYIGDNEIYLDGYKLYESDSLNKLVMKVYGTNIQSKGIDYYEAGLEAENLSNTKIEIISTSEIKMDNLKSLESKISQIEKVTTQLEIAKEENQRNEQLLTLLENEAKNTFVDSTAFKKLCQEINLLFPHIQSVSVGYTQTSNFEEYAFRNPTLLVKWNKNSSRKTQLTEIAKLKEWLAFQESMDKVEIIEVK